VSGTIVLFDRTVDAASSSELRDASRIVLVRCRLVGDEFPHFSGLVAIDCDLDRACFYWGDFWQCTFVRCRFASCDLRANYYQTLFHECTFARCRVDRDNVGGEPLFCDVQFTECTFDNTDPPRVVRGDTDTGGLLCPKGASTALEEVHDGYVWRHRARGDGEVVGPITYGVAKTAPVFGTNVAYTSIETGIHSLERYASVFLNCEVAGFELVELGSMAVFVDCTWREVAVRMVVSEAVFVGCDFVDVDWSCWFRNCRFVRCTFRRCRFAGALDPRPEDFDEDDFDVHFDDCVFELCNPPTLR
jgi:hypothetical protein